MEVFHSIDGYFRMAGVQRSIGHESNGFSLIRFSDNRNALRRSTPIYRNNFYEITLSYPQRMAFTVSGERHSTIDSPVLSFVAPLEIQQCSSEGYDNEVEMLLVSKAFMHQQHLRDELFRRFPLFNPSVPSAIPLCDQAFAQVQKAFADFRGHLNACNTAADAFGAFYSILEKCITSPIRNENRAAEIFEQFLAEVHRSPSELRSIRQLADRLHITPGHLSDTVKEVSKHPPKYHLNRFKNAVAKMYLTHTNLSIQEIATDLHFSSHAHFSAFFKSMNGLTPQTYRKLPKNM